MKLLFRLFEDIFQSSRQGNSLTKIDLFLMNTRFPGFIEAIIKTLVCNYEDKEEPHYAEMHDNTKLFNAITDINWIMYKREFY